MFLGETTSVIFTIFFSQFLFVLMFNVPVNSFVHVEMVFDLYKHTSLYQSS